jgi:HK97 family phage major capsid protein
LYAYPQASEWSLQDIFFNVQDWITSEIAEGFALNLSLSIFSGNGTNQPTGMTNTTPTTGADYASPLRGAAIYQYTSMSGLSPTSPNVIHMDSVINLAYTLNPRYRQNAKFAFNTLTQGILRRLKSTDGQYYWQPSLQAGQPDRLMGYPVFTWENLANGNTVDGFCGAFGDFKKGYVLSYRKELAVTVDQVTNPGYTRFYVRRRYGGCPLNNDAVKFLRNQD